MKKILLLTASFALIAQGMTAHYVEDDLEDENDLVVTEDEYDDEYDHYSADVSPPRKTYTQPKSTQYQKQTEDEAEQAKFGVGINTPVRPVLTDSCNLWLMGDVLCRQATEDNLY